MGCPRLDSVPPGSWHGPRGGGEAPDGGGIAGDTKRVRQGASAAEYLWISGLGASLLASLGGRPEFKMQIRRFHMDIW